MYIKYIYQLYEMNCRLQNKIEAAHTLTLHARLLDVNQDIVSFLPFLKIVFFFNLKWDAEKTLEEVHLKYFQNHQDIKTHDQLKKKLYQDIIQLFNEGDVKENSYFFFFFVDHKLFRLGKKQLKFVKNYKFNMNNHLNMINSVHY